MKDLCGAEQRNLWQGVVMRVISETVVGGYTTDEIKACVAQAAEFADHVVAEYVKRDKSQP